MQLNKIAKDHKAVSSQDGVTGTGFTFSTKMPNETYEANALKTLVPDSEIITPESRKQMR